MTFDHALRSTDKSAEVYRFKSVFDKSTVAAIVITLAARFVSVGLPLSLFRRYRRLPEGTVRILTWGGLRGGISVALALTLPVGPHRETLVTITYHVVVFSILVQGLTVKRLVRGVVSPA